MILRELRFFLLWFFWSPIGFVINALPLHMVYGCAKLVAEAVHLLYHFSSKHLETVLQEMFPERNKAESTDLARKTLQQWFMYEFENICMKRLLAEAYYDTLQISGLDRLDAALAKGKGVILLIAHFGAHLQIIPALATRGYTVDQVSNALPLKAKNDAKLGFFETRYYAAQHMRHGQFIPAQMIIVDKFARTLFRHLSKNEIVIIAIDGQKEGNLSYHKFLGYDSYPFSNGPISLALKTGAIVLPSFTVRDVDDRNKIFIEQEIIVHQNTDNTKKGIESHTADFVKLLETYIRKHPNHCGKDYFAYQKIKNKQD